MKQAKSDAFFYQSALTVLTASILSGNFYLFYWFYKQWKTVGLSEGKKPRPFIATIFSEFTAFVLFKKIWQAAPLKTVKNKQVYLVPAILSLVLTIVVTVVSILFIKDTYVSVLLSFGAVVVNAALYSWVQRIINATAPKNTFASKKLHLNSPEIIFLVVGFVVFFSNVPALLFLPSPDTIMRRTDDFQKTTGILGEKYKVLDTAYSQCARDIDARYKVLDTANEVAVDTYNKDLGSCQDVLKQRDGIGAQINQLSAQLIKSLFEK
ncbi:MAG TPA: hypothetical protein VIM31_03340 [Candidatus Microsaccharimonas sp.]|jgi:hypothetical protein